MLSKMKIILVNQEIWGHNYSFCSIIFLGILQKYKENEIYCKSINKKSKQHIYIYIRENLYVSLIDFIWVWSCLFIVLK